jgi:hypothetical protein
VLGQKIEGTTIDMNTYFDLKSVNTKATDLEVLKRAVCCPDVLAKHAVGLLAPSQSYHFAV